MEWFLCCFINFMVQTHLIRDRRNDVCRNQNKIISVFNTRSCHYKVFFLVDFCRPLTTIFSLQNRCQAYPTVHNEESNSVNVRVALHLPLSIKQSQVLFQHAKEHTQKCSSSVSHGQSLSLSEMLNWQEKRSKSKFIFPRIPQYLLFLLALCLLDIGLYQTVIF